MKKNAFTKHDVEVTKKETGYSGFFDLNIYTLRHRQFEGEWGPEITREVFERGHAVAVSSVASVPNAAISSAPTTSSRRRTLRS